MSGLFAYAVRWRQIAWRRQGEQLAAREVARSRLTFASTGRGAPSSMVSADRRLSSEYNRAVNYGVRDVVPRCERGRYIERRLLTLLGPPGMSAIALLPGDKRTFRPIAIL